MQSGVETDRGSRPPIEDALDPGRVGKQLRVWRAECEMTQADVAEKIGVSAQQYQKYESGVTRIGLSRLFSICKALDRSPSVFLDAEPQQAEPGIIGQRASTTGTASPPLHDDGIVVNSLSSKLDLSYLVSEVVRNFMAISDPADREAAMFILKSYAEKSNGRPS